VLGRAIADLEHAPRELDGKPPGQRAALVGVGRILDPVDEVLLGLPLGEDVVDERPGLLEQLLAHQTGRALEPGGHEPVSLLECLLLPRAHPGGQVDANGQRLHRGDRRQQLIGAPCGVLAQITQTRGQRLALIAAPERIHRRAVGPFAGDDESA
jgi:hypothetical protein